MIAGGKVPATIFKQIKYSYMKKLTALIAALALFFSATAFDPSPAKAFSDLFNLRNSKTVNAYNVSKIVRTAFTEKFANASEVNWKETEGLYFAQFNQLDKSFVAAFSSDGEFLACARKVSIDALPMKVSEALYSQYAQHSISGEATEIVMDGETGYYLTAEGKKSIKILKCDASGNISVGKKIKKKVLVGRVEV